VPIYEYGCSACSHTVEVRHGVHGHGPTTCPVCGGSMRKLMSTPTIVFKGSGWATKEGKSGGVRGSNGSSGATTGAGGDGTSSEAGGAAAPAPATGSTAGSSPDSGSGD
jgi:putative FmdB family regulatory protein